MKKVLPLILSIFLFFFCRAQQIDLCLSGSGNDYIVSNIKYLQDSSKLYLVQTDSRDGIYINDSANLYLIKTDKFDHIQFVHPLYYKSDDTTSNSTEPFFRLASIYANNNEIFIAFSAEYLYEPSFYYRYRLNYEIVDYNGSTIKKVNNAAVIVDYDYSIESRYSLDQLEIISSGEGNYSVMIKMSFHSHGDITETFPFFKIANNELDTQSVFGFETNRSPFSFRYILPVRDYFIIPFLRTDIYDTGGDAFPSINIINTNGDMVYDTIVSRAPHTIATDFSNENDRLFFTIYSFYTTGLLDSLNNPIHDSIIAKSYTLNFESGFQLTQVLYQSLSVSKPNFYDYPSQFIFIDPTNINPANPYNFPFPDIRNSYLLRVSQVNDSTYHFGLIDLFKNSFPEIFSFVTKINSYNINSINYKTFILPDSSLIFIYLIKGDNNLHIVKFNSGHLLISEQLLPVTINGYDKIFFNYLPISKNLLALTTGASSNLYLLNYADTISAFKDTLLLSVNADNGFESFEDGIGNIYAYVQSNPTTNECFDQTYDVIIYKIAGNLPTKTKYQKNFQNISCYPNPSSNYLEIDVSKLSSQSFSIRLYSNEGKLAFYNTYQNNIGSLRVDVCSIPSGIYQLIMSTNGEIIGNTKIVIGR